MKKMKLQDNSNYNFLGRQYTFFLSNYDLPRDNFFLYTIVSPGMMRDLETPMISLKKVGERCKPGIQGFEQDRDILTYCLGRMALIRRVQIGSRLLCTKMT